MKKTLTALCVAMASSGAMAWTAGDFNGTVNFGGTLGKPSYNTQWEWQVGDGLDTFVNSVSELTNNGTELLIRVTGDKPILLGKTTAPIDVQYEHDANGDITSRYGAAPSISLTDYTSDRAIHNPPDTSSDFPEGRRDEGYIPLVLQIKDVDTDQEIGTLLVNVISSAVELYDFNGEYAVLQSLRTDSDWDMFSGGLAGVPVQSARAAAEVTEKFGSLSAAELLQQLQTVRPNLTRLDDHLDYAERGNMDDTFSSFAYAMGMADGDVMKAVFHNPVTSTTHWVAPLNITITYS